MFAYEPPRKNRELYIAAMPHMFKNNEKYAPCEPGDFEDVNVYEKLNADTDLVRNYYSNFSLSEKLLKLHR